MEELKPLKRSKELAPLSREHHDGLLFTWKLKQGLKNGTPVETMCNYINWFWVNHLLSHFDDEEKILLKHLPSDNDLVNQLLKEHQQIRGIINLLNKEPGAAVIEQLADLLNKHIRFEERHLFEFAERTLSEKQLQDIFNHLPAVVSCTTEWKYEFWLKKKVN